MKWVVVVALLVVDVAADASPSDMDLSKACHAQLGTGGSQSKECVQQIAKTIVMDSKRCFDAHPADEASYTGCCKEFCGKQCGQSYASCQGLCTDHAYPLFSKFGQRQEKLELHEAMKQQPVDQDVDEAPRQLALMDRAAIMKQAHEAAGEEAEAMGELQAAQARMRRLNDKIAARAQNEIKNGNAVRGRQELAKVAQLNGIASQIDEHLGNVEKFRDLAKHGPDAPPTNFLQRASVTRHAKAPEDDLAKEMTHDLEMNFNKIAPFGKEDTAKELQDHAAKTQDTLVDAVENAEVAEIKRAVFRALTRLRAATIKEFDTIARLETQAIDAYNDAHHYRAENPLTHLHEDEAPVETDKLKSFH